MLLKSLLHAAAERELVSREPKFQRKKMTLGGISAAIARDGTIRADDAVTRDDDGKTDWRPQHRPPPAQLSASSPPGQFPHRKSSCRMEFW